MITQNLETFGVSLHYWKRSVFFHLFFLFSVAIIVYGWPQSGNEKIEITVLEKVTMAPSAPRLNKVDVKPREKKITKNAVFGISRRTLLENDNINSVEVKAGNTIAKEQDDLKLKDTDPDSLPTPTDEYLVTRMPELQDETKVAFTAEAKKNNIDGKVIMDLLIDQDGNVRKIDFISGPGYGLNEAAVEAVKKFKFKPALLQDKPVAVRIRYAYTFVLQK